MTAAARLRARDRLTGLLTTLAQARWPATLVLPRTAFSVMSKPFVIFRPVRLEQVVVVTTCDASFSQERKRRCRETFLTRITTCGVEKGASICTTIEFNSTVIHRVTGSELAAEQAVLTNSVDRQLYVRPWVDALLIREPQGGSDWRSRLEVLGIMVTGANSPSDHLQKMASISQ